jgi:hypothetical protein
MALTEYRRGQVVAAVNTALQRAENVVPQMTACKQSVLDSRANYLKVKQLCSDAGMTQPEIDEQFGADFAADAGAIFDKAGPQLVALLAEVSRITGTTARAALTALAAAAPDTAPADNETVTINPGTGAVTFE